MANIYVDDHYYLDIIQYVINEWRMKQGTFKISRKTTKDKTYYTAAIVKKLQGTRKSEAEDDKVFRWGYMG